MLCVYIMLLECVIWYPFVLIYDNMGSRQKLPYIINLLQLTFRLIKNAFKSELSREFLLRVTHFHFAPQTTNLSYLIILSTNLFNSINPLTITYSVSFEMIVEFAHYIKGGVLLNGIAFRRYRNIFICLASPALKFCHWSQGRLQLQCRP